MFSVHRNNLLIPLVLARERPLTINICFRLTRAIFAACHISVKMQILYFSGAYSGFVYLRIYLFIPGLVV